MLRRPEGYEITILASFTRAGVAWAIVGVWLLIQWPVMSLQPLGPGEVFRLALSLPGFLGLLAATALAQTGLPLPDEALSIFPAATGLLFGLLVGSLLILRVRGQKGQNILYPFLLKE